MTRPPAGVGRTALGAARVRADETRRPDPLFRDPFAQLFLDAAPDLLPQAPDRPDAAPGLAAIGAAFARHGVVRTRFFDDHLREVAAAGTDQVVLLAAGLDTRAFRLDWPPGASLFEVDRPDVLVFKQTVLDGAGARPRCRRAAVDADLAGDWLPLLLGAGFDPERRTAWLAEGLLVYLDHAGAEQLLTTVSGASAPGSTLALEAGAGPLLERARELPTMAPLAALLKGGLHGGPAGWLAEHGWRTDVHEGLGAARGRNPPDDPGGRFVVATRGVPPTTGGTRP